uniref:PPR_long domain-containing protein n=1 Tax=Trichuris muris TaxID=70415 RepID=A0A5S6QYZ1_TRIMR
MTRLLLATSSRFGSSVLRRLCSTVGIGSSVPSADVFGTLSSVPSPDNDEEEEGVEFKPLVVMEHNHSWFGRRCDKLGRAGKIAECLAMLQKRMPEEGVKPKRYNYVVVLGWLGRYGLVKKAFELHEQMVQMKIRPSRHSYTCLLNACANSIPSEAAWALARVDEVLKKARMIGPTSLDRALYHAAIKAYARSGDIQSAFLVADLMIVDGISPDVVTFTHVLQACLNDRESGFALALRVWQYMLKSGVALDAEALNNFIRICRDCGLGVDGDALLESLLAKGNVENQLSKVKNADLPTVGISSPAMSNEAIVPSNAHPSDTRKSKELVVAGRGTTSIRSLKLSLIGGAQGLFDQLKKANARPNRKTFTLMLDLLPNDVSSEEWLLKVMRENRIPANLIFHNALIRRYALRGSMEEATALLHSLEKRNVSINENTLHCLAHGCLHEDDGLALCQKAKDMGISLSLQTCRVLISNALSNFNFLYARHLLEYMQRASVQPNKRLLYLLEQRLTEAGQLVTSQANQSPRDVRVVGLTQFKLFYERWLHSMCLAKRTDPRERLLTKDVSTDDIREAWEKPWAKQKILY